MTLFVRKFERFMKKKGYGTRKRRDNNKSRDYVRKYYSARDNNIELPPAATLASLTSIHKLRVASCFL
jgi:hypothetical protein